MPAIGIKGIRIKTVTITPNPSDGYEKISASYQLISTVDKVLAEQSLGGYSSDIKVPLSPATQKAMDAFLAGYRNDINATIGLDAE